MDQSLMEAAAQGQRSDQAPDMDTVAERGGAERHAHIVGWGADIKKSDRPAVPMERRPPRLEGVHWHHVEPQELRPEDEVLHSSERPGLTPIFGSKQPPTGISGGLRRLAFGWSENDIRHWLVLLAADRVNMVEGLVGDLAHGRVPNLWKEYGGPAEWKYNKKGLAKKAAVVAAVAGAWWLWRQRSDARRS
jgi:hypothetical protein